MRILGIAGPSCSGKTTLAQEVAGKLCAPTLSIDNFFKLGGPHFYVEHKGEKVRSFENPAIYDGKRMAEALQKLKGGAAAQVPVWNGKEYVNKDLRPARYFVVEGFLPQIHRLLSFVESRIMMTGDCS